ncbi:MAG: response regulator transcription factor [Niabella sp.]|nr:response regulator transcription factor [Niabella sp.]
MNSLTPLYNLPPECTAFLCKTFGEPVAIKKHSTIRVLIFDGITVIISKNGGDPIKLVSEMPAIANSRTILIVDKLSPISIRRLLQYNLLCFIDSDDLTAQVLETASKACFTENLFISKTILHVYKNTARSGKIVTLSKRELEVIRLISEELTTKEIASELFLSKRTVDTHRQNLMKKLNVRNNIGLVKAAILNNLVYHYILFLTMLTV